MLCTMLCIYSFAQEIATQKQNVFRGVHKVVVNADFCSLKLTGHRSDVVNFNGVIISQENLEAYGFEVNQQDDTLNIRVTKPEHWKSHWGEVILKLPEGIVIEAITQSGKVEATSVKGIRLHVLSKSGHVFLSSVEGSVTVTSPAGDLKAEGFSGVLKAKTKTGTVNVKGFNGNCAIECHKGPIHIADAQGTLFVDGGTGNLEVENVKGDITLKSTSGDTKLSIAKGNISVKTFDGDMKLFNTSGVYTVQSSTGNITGTRVVFTAPSSFASTEGNIKVQMNTKENLAFELKSSHAYVRAMGKSKKKSLKIGKGDILITGTSTTGSQAYY